jgi:hypothetical protein
VLQPVDSVGGQRQWRVNGAWGGRPSGGELPLVRGGRGRLDRIGASVCKHRQATPGATATANAARCDPTTQMKSQAQVSYVGVEPGIDSPHIPFLGRLFVRSDFTL